jgi:hypothetical protein
VRLGAAPPAGLAEAFALTRDMVAPPASIAQDTLSKRLPLPSRGLRSNHSEHQRHQVSASFSATLVVRHSSMQYEVTHDTFTTPLLRFQHHPKPDCYATQPRPSRPSPPLPRHHYSHHHHHHTNTATDTCSCTTPTITDHHLQLYPPTYAHSPPSPTPTNHFNQHQPTPPHYDHSREATLAASTSLASTQSPPSCTDFARH